MCPICMMEWALIGRPNHPCCYQARGLMECTVLYDCMNQKINNAMRWVLLLPCSVLAAWIVYALTRIVHSLINAFRPTDGAQSLGTLFNDGVAHFMMGFVFVGAGVLIAPKNRQVTAHGLCVLGLLFSGWGIVEYLRQREWTLVIVFAALVAGLISGAYYFRSADEKLDSAKVRAQMRGDPGGENNSPF